MQKRKNLNEIIKYLRENEVCIFDLDDFVRMFDIKRNYAAQVIMRLKRENAIIEFEKGKYILEGTENPLSIGCFSIKPSYISFKTALAFYKFIKNNEEEIYLATPKRKASFRFHSHVFRYIFFKSYKFFGFTDTIIERKSIKIALPEKAIVDSIMLQEYGPEIEEIIRIVNDRRGDFSIDRMIKYAIRMNDKSLIARLLFILHSAGLEVNIDEKYLPKFYIKLIPNRERKGKWIHRFRIINNL